MYRMVRLFSLIAAAALLPGAALALAADAPQTLSQKIGSDEADERW